MISQQIFQKLWSGHVTCEEKAFELLTLIEEIHDWSITMHRSFVLEHLRAWHNRCDENLFLEWDSRFDRGDKNKRRRELNKAGQLNLPTWVSHFNEPSQRSIQHRARKSLQRALKDDHDIRRKFDGDLATLKCKANGCSHKMVPWISIVVHIIDQPIV